MTILEAVLRTEQARKSIKYLEEKLWLGFDMKKIDHDLGEDFIREVLTHIDNCFKECGKLSSSVLKSLNKEKFDENNTLMDAIINLNTVRKKQAILDKSVVEFIKEGNLGRVRKYIEQFSSALSLIEGLEKGISYKISTIEVEV